jgi:hypothetical protein
MFEENINLVNEIVEDEESNKKKQEEQSSMGNFDANSMMKNAQNMTNNLPKY